MQVPDAKAHHGGGTRTPGARARRDSCMRTLMVSAQPRSVHLHLCTGRAAPTYPADGTPMPPSCLLHHQLFTTTTVSPCDFKCEVTLATSIGHLPIRFVAADAGFFPLGPLTLFADIFSNIKYYVFFPIFLPAKRRRSCCYFLSRFHVVFAVRFELQRARSTRCTVSTRRCSSQHNGLGNKSSQLLVRRFVSLLSYHGRGERIARYVPRQAG